MIKAEKISKSFGSKSIISDISFTVNNGEFLTITGASGCGKSTILNILSGLISPDSGSVIRTGKKTGYAFQKDILIPWKSALENILYIMKGHIPLNQAYDTAASLLEQIGLADDMHKKPYMMSGGMKKRVNIARAISIKPDILLLDEPFAFLDEKNIEEIKKIILQIQVNDDCAVILVNHDNKYADNLPGKTIEITSAGLRNELT